MLKDHRCPRSEFSDLGINEFHFPQAPPAALQMPEIQSFEELALNSPPFQEQHINLLP